MDKDFDSEEEYGNEGGESSEGEMDDGKMSDQSDDSENSMEEDDENEMEWQKDEEDPESSSSEEENVKAVPDYYRMDPNLVRREATLLQLI